ncbi:hypothetical protein LSH36_34g04079 [Paralvinella palmiformis]|uniref:Protein sleepless n=1 Tax=Paralvinella palmiformis TaxID=53620 RepID=A0AAD9K8C7_9ANNE|nr:hypothetical protein LSH36_34g04079 [Paralvinella palmiformis]
MSIRGGAWKKVTRRCGSRSESGVAWGCQWTFEENGVWREVCYCEDRDGCNGASNLHINHGLAMSSIAVISLIMYHLL